MLGIPTDALILLEELVADGGGFDVPARLGEIEQRCVAAPTKRVAVSNPSRGPQQTAFLQITDDERIGFLEELAGKLR